MLNCELHRASADSKRIVLLQGPVGPFFRNVSQTLRAQGHSTVHVCLTLPDYIMSGADDVRAFRGGREEFCSYLREILVTEQVDRILVMGCERYAHSQAIKMGAELNIPVLSLEEGYIRPGFVTAEWMGNNRISPIRGLSDETLKNEPRPNRIERGSESRFAVLICVSIFHFVLRAIGAVYYGRKLYHRKRPLLPEAFYWFRNMMRKYVGRGRNKRTIDKLLQLHSGKFYILPLQVSDDLQLVAAGNGWNNETFSETVVCSFAEYAPQDSVLLVKMHPFERGHPSPKRKLMALAKRLNIQDRIFVVDDGNLGNLTKKSCGMITINSTSGLLALQHRTPLAVAGDAIFSRPSLCFSARTAEELNLFWKNAKAADKDTARGFRWAVLNRSLLPGNFYSSHDRHYAADAVATRLIHEVPQELMVQTATQQRLVKWR